MTYTITVQNGKVHIAASNGVFMTVYGSGRSDLSIVPHDPDAWQAFEEAWQTDPVLEFAYFTALDQCGFSD